MSTLHTLLNSALEPIDLDEPNYAGLLAAIGNRSVILLGEATHGTHEFYRERARITQRLILEKGFNAVAVEADWPAAMRVNQYVSNRGQDENAEQALGDFTRFPAWMWRNTVMTDFVEWLRGRHVGFYGLDLYSLYASIDAVINYLDRVDPEAAARARRRYSCLEHFGGDPQEYGYATSRGLTEPCEDDVVKQLMDLRARASEYARRDGWVAEDEFFSAEQNARLAANAERYYRAMFRGRVSSWNLRDEHMADTADALIAHLSRDGQSAKIVIWAHNSHLGDARATEMGEQGEWNLGQLMRERHGDAVYIAGFSTYEGSVTAASEWDGPAERKVVRRGLPGSQEELFHELKEPDFLLNLRQHEVAPALGERRLQRAIGVIYLPETERMSHYFHVHLPEQFDAVLHFDRTGAVHPLERTSDWLHEEAPQTYPSAL